MDLYIYIFFGNAKVFFMRQFLKGQTKPNLRIYTIPKKSNYPNYVGPNNIERNC